MAIRDFILPRSHSSLASYPLNPTPFGIMSPFGNRTFSISATKGKPVRKSPTAKKPPSCVWYEAEDRNLPSVSSF